MDKLTVALVSAGFVVILVGKEIAATWSTEVDQHVHAEYGATFTVHSGIVGFIR